MQQPTTRTVLAVYTYTAPGIDARFGVWSEEAEITCEVRAEVTDLGDAEEPCVIWCDKGAVEHLSPEQQIGAREAAIAEYDRVNRIVKAWPMVGQIVRTVSA